MHLIRPSDTKRTPTSAAARLSLVLLATGITSVALLATGCGSSSPGPPTSQSFSSFAADAYKFSSCMRTHGVTNFPDPRVINTPGQQSIRQEATPVARANAPKFKAAQQACQGIMPAPSNISPAQQAAQQHARVQDRLAFARCLRDHGVPNFPDPTSQGHLTLQMITTAGVDLHAPAVLTAARVCVGVTNGTITLADVERAVNGTQ